MHSGVLGTHNVDRRTRRRWLRAAVALTLLGSLFVVAPPHAQAVDFTVSFVTSGSTTVAESGTHTVNVVLNTAGLDVSGADILIDVSDTGGGDAGSGDYVFVSPETLTFPAGSGNGAIQPATVTISPDTDHEPEETIELSLSVNDAGVDAVTLGAEPVHLVAIADDDPVTVSFTDPTSATSESGTHTTTLTLTVPGGGALAEDVDVDVTVAGGTAAIPDDFTLTTPTVSFAAGSADEATGNVQMAIATDDIDETDETIDLSIAPAAGPAVAADTHEVTITDDDGAGVTVSDTDLAITENTAGATYTVVLTSEPTDTVTITPNDTDGNVLITPPSRTFTALTWSTPQQFTVIVPNDDVAVGARTDTVTHDVTSADTAYLGLAVADVAVAITDDDTAGVTVNPQLLTVTEGDTEDPPTYSVVLTSEPTGTVTITPASTSGEATVSPAFLNFNSNNWDTPKDFTVRAVDDDLIDGTTGDVVTHTAGSGDPNYAGVAIASVAVTVLDDDIAPVANPDFYNVDEGGTLSTTSLTRVLINDTGELPLTAVLVTPPTHHVGVFTLTNNGNFTYVHDGSAPVTDTFTYRVVDNGGAGNQSDPAVVTITIDNVAPTVDAGEDPAPVMEGEDVAVNATFLDPGLGDTHTATIDWGDGTVDSCSTPACTITFIGPNGTVEGTHSYGAVDVYTVTVSVNDGTATGVDSVTVSVVEAGAIQIGFTPFPDLDEGGQATLDATFDDPDGRGVHAATVDWGDGTVHNCATDAGTIVDNGDGTGTVAGTHFYLDDGPYTVVVTVFDGSGDEGSGGATITVNNVAPAVEITNAAGDRLPASSQGGSEGVMLRLRPAIVDPGDEEFTFDWKIRLLGQVVASSTTNRINYRPTENGTYFVSLTVDDGDGGVDSDSVLIVISNAVPVIDRIVFDGTPAVGVGAPMSVFFSDPGTSDDHVVTVAWGEGSPQGKPGASPQSFNHTYSSAGTRTALVCVTDDDGGETCESFYVNPGVAFSISSDFDGNGFEDLPIGVPGEDGFGAVSVLYATSKGVRTTADDVWKQGVAGIRETGEPGDMFGSELAWGDFNLDGFADLVVAAPGEDIGGNNDAGIVHVIYGSATGLTPGGDRVFHQGMSGLEGSNQPGDRFGAALAVGDFNNDGFADLGIGVPNEKIGGMANTGRVVVLFGSPTGLVAAGDESWHQDKPGVIGHNKPGDKRGQGLAAGDFDRDGAWDLAIGIPGKKVNNKAKAGGVLVMGGSILGLDATADQWWSQQSGTVLNKAEKGDRFGAVLEVGDFNGDNRHDLAIGIPREGVDGLSSAGAVAVLLSNASGLTDTGNTFWHEGVPGVLGDLKAGDRFGFALAAGDFNDDGRDDLAIGIPYQEVGAKKDAGQVAILNGGPAGLRTTGNQRWSEASPGIKGGANRNDHFGWALRAFDERADGDSDLAIGIPDQNVGGVSNAGAVLVIKGRSGGITPRGDTYWHQNTAGVREAAGTADRFGKAL